MRFWPFRDKPPKLKADGSDWCYSHKTTSSKTYFCNQRIGHKGTHKSQLDNGMILMEWNQ